jgi:hypothetical protein
MIQNVSGERLTASIPVDSLTIGATRIEARNVEMSLLNLIFLLFASSSLSYDGYALVLFPFSQFHQWSCPFPDSSTLRKWQQRSGFEYFRQWSRRSCRAPIKV